MHNKSLAVNLTGNHCGRTLFSIGHWMVGACRLCWDAETEVRKPKRIRLDFLALVLTCHITILFILDVKGSEFVHNY